MIAVIDEVMARDDYATTNDIFLLEDCLPAVALDELDAITSAISRNYPHGASRSKTAIVVTDGLLKVITELWTKTASTLPYQVRIFPTLHEAEQWVGFK